MRLTKHEQDLVVQVVTEKLQRMAYVQSQTAAEELVKSLDVDAIVAGISTQVIHVEYTQELSIVWLRNIITSLRTS